MVSESNVIEMMNNMNMICLMVTIVECDVFEMNEAVIGMVEDVNDVDKMMKYDNEQINDAK